MLFFQQTKLICVSAFLQTTVSAGTLKINFWKHL